MDLKVFYCLVEGFWVIIGIYIFIMEGFLFYNIGYNVFEVIMYFEELFRNNKL